MHDRLPKGLSERSSNGLSLIEVCIAIAILAVMLTSFSGIFNQGYRFLRKARMNNLACLLAQEQMEKLLHNSSFSYLGSINGATQPLSAPYQDFSGQVNITYPATGEGSSSSVDANLTRITVTIYWQGQSGQQNLTLTSLVSNLPH
jgi:prepilin-type N-terminal cleavage/methylation domain-containing protein